MEVNGGSQHRARQQRPATAAPRSGPDPSGAAFPATPAGHQQQQAQWASSAHGWMDGAPRQQPQQQQRPSSAPMRTTGVSWLRKELGDKTPQRPSQRSARIHSEQRPERAYGRVSLFDHSTGDRAAHQHLGPVVMRDLSPPKHGLPARAPEEFLRKGQGLELQARVRLKGFLQQHPINRDPPFKPGNSGIVLSFEASAPSPHTLFKTYYDNGTIDFVSVRWRGSRQDGLVWGRRVTARSNTAAPTSYRTWCEEPLEVELQAWLPIFTEGILERNEPYHFMAVRGAEEMLFMAGDRLHELAPSLVLPLKQLLDTRHPPTVGVALQMMHNALSLDPTVALEWIHHLWQFAQVFNLFLGKPKLAIDMGYASHTCKQLRTLVTEVLHMLEAHGGERATALVRRYCRGHDPAVTPASQARAAAQLAAKSREAAQAVGVEVEAVAAFKPFTLF